MLRKILAIAGKPGLYRLVSRGNRNLIVESLDASHKRMPAFGTDRIMSLADIAMYTQDDQVPLAQVLTAIAEQNGKGKVALNYKKASKDELADFMAAALPDYDRDRVHTSDIQKLIQWYNLLIEAGVTDFAEAAAEE